MTKSEDKQVLAYGVGLSNQVAQGVVVDWNDEYLVKSEELSGKVVYYKDSLPLYKAAFIVESGAAALIIGEGSKNYHPLILATEAGVPALAGTGIVDLNGKEVTVSPRDGCVLGGLHMAEPQPVLAGSQREGGGAFPVYVNVGYPSALKEAAESGADGVGLVRTEFAAVRAISRNLLRKASSGKTLLEMLHGSNEADIIYEIADDNSLSDLLRDAFREVIRNSVSAFPGKDIFIRTLDIARSHNDPMGNRGIRRDVASGGNTIRLLAEAIYAELKANPAGAKLGIILPLVSHYSQIRFALNTLLASGLSLIGSSQEKPENAVYFGWEIEQPAASQSNELWIEAFEAEFKQVPHLIGIGTNDLTQFTIALGRDAASNESEVEYQNYLSKIYDERDFSVMKQVVETNSYCKKKGTRVFLLGQIGANSLIASLMYSIGVIPSVGASKVGAIREALNACGAMKQHEPVLNYIDQVLSDYPVELHEKIRAYLIDFFRKNGACVP